MPRNITVTFSDGSSHVYQNAPDNLSPEQVTQRAQQDFGKPVSALDGGRRAAPAQQKTDDSAIHGFALGAIKPVENLARFLNFGGVGDKINAMFGYPAQEEISSQRNAMREANTRKGWQTIGNIAGTIPTAAIPGGPFVQGAVGGALLSDRKTPQGVVTDAAISGIGGKIGQGMVNSFAYAAKPVTNTAGRMLHEAGVPQTLGQIARQGKGVVARGVAAAEDALSSVPFLGDAINTARGRGVDAFNTAVANRALKNIGGNVPKGMEPGIEMVDFVGDKLSQKYQSLVPKLSATYDRQFVDDLTSARDVTSVLPAARQRQFAQIVRDVLGNRSQGNKITGQELKDAESRLTTLYKKFSKSTDADQTILADAIDGVRQALRSSVGRSNPSHAKELQAINRGWAQLATYRGAANAPGNATGVVTPAQMLAASRKSGFRDELSNAAKEVLPSQLPDSGTARRAMQAAAASSVAGATLNPWLAAPAAGSILYTKPAMRALNAFVYAPRGKAATAVGNNLRRLGRVAPSAVPPLLQKDR